MFRDRFAPLKLSRYNASLDEARAQAVRSRIYVSDDLRLRSGVDEIITTGTIECENGLRIEIEERLRLLRRTLLHPHWRVELVSYRYNAVLLNRGTIFRYNSPHEDHRRFHHVHRFDVLGTGAETVEEIRERDVPTLRQVVEEAGRWYWDHLMSRG